MFFINTLWRETPRRGEHCWQERTKLGREQTNPQIDTLIDLKSSSYQRGGVAFPQKIKKTTVAFVSELDKIKRLEEAAALCSSDTSIARCPTPVKPLHGDGFSTLDVPSYSPSLLAIWWNSLISPEVLNNQFSKRRINKPSGRKEKRQLKELLGFWVDENLKLSRVIVSIS